MNKPKMIVFDYGGTLCREPGHDFERGMRAAFEHVSNNPKGVTFEQYMELDNSIWVSCEAARGVGVEAHQFQMMRLVNETLGLEFDVSMEEIEEITWTAASAGEALPHVTEMLDYLNESGIRTGVVSNIGWSGGALSRRIDRLLPNNKFEFVIASSEYAIRKPSPLLYGLALSKAGLSAGEVWYCGDSYRADVQGASGAGMFPVLYANESIGRSPWAESNDGVDIEVEHLRIGDWLELVDILKKM